MRIIYIFLFPLKYYNIMPTRISSSPRRGSYRVCDQPFHRFSRPRHYNNITILLSLFLLLNPQKHWVIVISLFFYGRRIRLVRNMCRYMWRGFVPKNRGGHPSKRTHDAGRCLTSARANDCGQPSYHIRLLQQYYYS